MPFSLIEMLGSKLPMIDVVDVGAMWMGAESVGYMPLLKAGVARVVGFEPNQAECDRLNELKMPNNRYLPNGHCPVGADRAQASQDEGRREIAVYLPANGAFLSAVALMAANNETGVLFPMAEIGKIVRERSEAVFHVDGVQAVGKIPIDLKTTEVDLFALSGHKLHAPQGIRQIVLAECPKRPHLVYHGDADA